ncbi:hypothetical protein VYU27_009567 [Nannochloropsis oceanica]
MPLPTTSSAGGMGSPPPSGAGGTSTSSSNHVHHAQGNHHLQGHSEKKSSSRQSREEQRLARRLFQIQDRSLTVLRVLFVIGIPLTIINISFACAYAWLFANQYAYTKDDWQRCLIYPNQVGSEEGRKGSEGGKAEEDGWREHAWIYGVCFA